MRLLPCPPLVPAPGHEQDC